MTENISVIIITRNRAEKLNGCLKSLVKQTHRPDEVIIVDNSSSDNTKDVVAHYSSRERSESRSLNSSRLARTITIETASKLPIRYIFEKQIGIPFARNKGLQHTTGTLILMLDDDCEADKNWVKNMIYAHKKYPKAWVVQGMTISLPKEQLYSLISDFKRFISIKRYSKNKLPLSEMKNFLFNDFKDVLKFFTCDTRNFSIKTSYLVKHKLEFDTNFYYGEDMDFGRQIVEKNGLIIFYPLAQVTHWERSSLAEFLIQRWRFGRAAAKIADKWKSPSLMTNIKFMLSPKIPFAFLLFCGSLKKKRYIPILIILLLLDRFYHFSGWFYEKKLLLAAKRQ